MRLRIVVLLFTVFVAVVSCVQAAADDVHLVPASQAPITGTSYVLGPGDSLTVHAANVPEMSDKAIRIDTNGVINLPMAGRIEANGMTVEALEAEISKRLRVFLEAPDVSVTITEYQSQPVSVFGEVASPGVHQLQGRKTLVELIASAGGAREAAGPFVRITRRLEYGRIPLPGAKDDSTGRYSIAELELKPLVDAKTPENDILIKPYDVIAIPKANMIYIAGDVTKSGSITLSDKPTMSVMEALSTSGGMTKTAQPQKARILRLVAGSSIRQQVPVNISKIMTGKINDQDLVAGDILFVPSSAAKKASYRALEAAVQAGTIILTSSAISGTL